MKIRTTKEKLDPVLTQAERAVSKSPTLPVLGCIYLSAEKGMLTVSATNLDLGVEFSFPVKMEKPGAVALHSNALRALVFGVRQGGSIELEVKDGALFVSTEQQQATIKTLPHEEFPLIPKMTREKALILNADQLAKVLHSVCYSASLSSVKQELASVYIYSMRDSLIAVATDGIRLAEKKTRVDGLVEGISFLLPIKNTQDISHILEERGGAVTLYFSDHQIGIHHNDYYLVTRVTEGTFPDYKAIIPKQNTTEAIVLKQDLVGALKTMAVFTNTLHQVRVEVSSKKKELFLVAHNGDVGECRERVSAALTGGDITVTVNHRYFLECFQSINTDSVSLSFSGSMKPVIVRGISDPSFLYLLMPMSV